MPLLGGFVQLAIVIFLCCFMISYLLHKPQQALGRTFGLAFFAVVTGIDNEQAYSFIALVTTILMFSLVLLVIHTCSGLRLFETKESEMTDPTPEAS